MSDNKKKYTLENGYMSIHEILASNGVNQRNLINEINKDEKIEGRETYDMIEADIEGNNNKTKISKERFINEMKKGLGESIKNNPNTIKVGKKSIMTKIGLIIKKIFTKF